MAETRKQAYGAVDVGDDRQHRLKGWTIGAGVDRLACLCCDTFKQIKKPRLLGCRTSERMRTIVACGKQRCDDRGPETPTLMVMRRRRHIALDGGGPLLVVADNVSGGHVQIERESEVGGDDAFKQILC